MATALAPDKLISILKDEGVRVAEYPGWRDRDRDDETGRPFGPVHMVLNHHTAGRDSLALVARSGVPGLPGPLAHIHLAKSGTATLVSAGRSNHAGTMAKNAYDSFLNERELHPRPDKSSGTVDGNDVSYGIETENLGNGTDTYTRAQYDAWVRINAAFCRFYGWSAQSVACHKETSVEGKVDPKGPVEGYGTRGRFEFTPSLFRADVAERLLHVATWSPGKSEEKLPVKQVPGKDVEASRPQSYKDVVETDAIPAPTGHPDAATNKFWTMESYLKFIAEELIRRRDS